MNCLFSDSGWFLRIALWVLYKFALVLWFIALKDAVVILPSVGTQYLTIFNGANSWNIRTRPHALIEFPFFSSPFSADAEMDVYFSLALLQDFWRRVPFAFRADSFSGPRVCRGSGLLFSGDVIPVTSTAMACLSHVVSTAEWGDGAGRTALGWGSRQTNI